MSASGIGANVFITGANRGIGLGLVKEIAKVGGVQNIFAGCRDPINAKHLNELEKSTNSVVKLVQIDVQNDESIKAALQTVKKSIGGESALNLLINNAGILGSKGVTIENPDRTVFAQHFDVNTIGAAMTTAAFLPLIRQAGASNESAKVVNISATLGSTTLVQDSKLVPNNNIVYGMSKAALMHYTKVLAGDLKKSNIIAVSLCPGWVKTDLGGSKAMLSVEQSVSAIVKLIEALNKDQSGAFLDRMGKKIAF